MDIGQRIAQKRKELGLSQEALGERLGVSRQSIYKWESDTALPEVEKLIALAKLFGVSIGWLLGVEEAAVSSDSGELTPAQLAMVQEIVDRYVAAMPQPKPRRRWPIVLAAVVLFFSIFNLFEELDMLQMRQDSILNDISRVESSVDRQINGISGRLEDPEGAKRPDRGLRHRAGSPGPGRQHRWLLPLRRPQDLCGGHDGGVPRRKRPDLQPLHRPERPGRLCPALLR